MRIGVTIAHPRAAAEDTFLKRLYNRSSANYHSFLTPSQYAKAFGVSTSTADAVRSWLGSGGLTIDYVSRARDYFLAHRHRLGGREADRRADGHVQLQRPDVSWRTRARRRYPPTCACSRSWA